MRTNLEIEFKTLITEDIYLKLLKEFNLQDNIFKQTNHYFDTDDSTLIKQNLVLRIRQKGENYKLTSKSHATTGAFEKHIFITPDQAKYMLENGFNASPILYDIEVHKVAELTTYRVSTTYKNGKLFFDKSEYYGRVDYEIEYEADSKEQGLIDFKKFLEEKDIPYIKSISKSKRAYLYRK